MHNYLQNNKIKKLNILLDLILLYLRLKILFKFPIAKKKYHIKCMNNQIFNCQHILKSNILQMKKFLNK